MASKVAVIGDSHFDETSRFDECIRLHHWIADDMRKRDVSVVVHTGDVYERRSTPRERSAAADWVQVVTEFAPLLVVRGNHDSLGDLPLLERLHTHHRVIVEEQAGVHSIGGIRIAAMAWPRKADVLAAAGLGPKELGDAVAVDALLSIFRGLGQELREAPGPTLFAAHAMVRGSVTSTGQPLVGCDFEVGLDDIALVGADAYALGHVHKGQSWTIDNSPVFYPGSPRRTAFGELEAKGYTLLEWQPDGTVTETFIEAPATRMVQLEGEWASEHVGLPGDVVVPAALVIQGSTPEECAGAEVRLRYHVERSHRDAAQSAVAELREHLIEAGAISVKVEERVVAETRARAPEVAQAISLHDKLEAHWVSKNFDPGHRREALLTKLSQLDERSRNVAV